jgi:signal transduction histidine kinase
VDRKKEAHAVTLDVRGLPQEVQFLVADNGIGMDQETREKAFTLFFSSKGSEGTGLGLFIAQKIAKAHGGQIAVDSAPDIGTRFLVTLPRQRPAKPTPGAPT